MKYSGWRFDEIISMTKCFYKTNEINDSRYVKFPLRSSFILLIESFDKQSFFWSILFLFSPCEISHSNRVSNYRSYFNETNLDEFDFTNRFKCDDFYKIEKLKNLSINLFELSFYQHQKRGTKIITY